MPGISNFVDATIEPAEFEILISQVYDLCEKSSICNATLISAFALSQSIVAI